MLDVRPLSLSLSLSFPLSLSLSPQQISSGMLQLQFLRDVHPKGLEQLRRGQRLSDTLVSRGLSVLSSRPARAPGSSSRQAAASRTAVRDMVGALGGGTACMKATDIQQRMSAC